MRKKRNSLKMHLLNLNVNRFHFGHLHYPNYEKLGFNKKKKKQGNQNTTAVMVTIAAMLLLQSSNNWLGRVTKKRNDFN